ncbi:MAG: N-acetyl-gamma-glutamyl-phosphate reductase [Proteobacteria bacterium]|nr:N-acetyl-gamma-glutamyl-phosphate reductase [Pseudomonadota bacterium]
MVRVGIIGATGYAGAELVRILINHPEVKLTTITSRQYAGVSFTDVYPAMSGLTDLVCEEFHFDTFCEKTDVVFTALPHKLPMEIIPKLLNKGKKVIDLSADFRFDNVDAYEAVYQAHTAKDLFKVSVYGLCEVNRDAIRHASLIGNPGCYPTTVLLALIPLLREGMIETTQIIADSKSGVSGAGRSLALATHFCEANEAFKAYKLDGHRHCPEMEEVLSKEAGTPISLTFVPHLLPMNRGMLSTIYTTITQDYSLTDIRHCFESFYKDRPFVRLYPDVKRPPDVKYVQYTNNCDIGFYVKPGTRRLVLISAIDNLVKGASGQAVQNMNIMMGIDETTGLR